jgi:sterol 24-C-methyltransferase
LAAPDTQHWHEDSAKDDDVRKESRLNQYTQVVNCPSLAWPFSASDPNPKLQRTTMGPPSCSLARIFATIRLTARRYEFGWGSSFHFARYYKGESFFQAIARHEHYLSAQIGLKPGMRVLDVGCGVGGPAREIARFSGASIVGVNNNDFQVDRANRYTQKTELAGQVSFVKGDFMKLSELFGENSFDAVYAIEATVHAPTFEGVYGEILKVLKPGGTVGQLRGATFSLTPCDSSASMNGA